MNRNYKGIKLLRIVTTIFITILFAIIMLLGLVYITVKGPSVNAREEFVIDMNKSSMDWIPGIFLSDDEINEILKKDK